MWNGKGRSGIGDTNIQGTWEDWGGLSPNGREYKNALTQEARNLSGADYWHVRKADTPDQEPDVWKNGKANIKAFADAPKKPAKKRSAFERICTMETAYERLQEQLEELDEEYYDHQLELEDWLYARKIITEKLDKQWKKICKARGWDADEEDSNIAAGIRESAMSQLAQDMQQKKHSHWTEQPVAEGNSFWHDVFYGLDESNAYRKLYFFVKRLFK
tara:strand:- start:17564 stop:18214 length:651 start_codon:yes stop_codon:yes gene_type:complete